VAFAALICKDAQSDHNPDYDDQCERIGRDFASSKFSHHIIAIPACATGGFHEGQIGQNLIMREPLKGTIHVLANSDFHQVKSCLTKASGEIIVNHGGRENRIVTRALTSL
jgi:hypothetical protein